MGWLGKSLAVILALMLLGAGVWQLALPIFAWLLLPPILRAWRRRPRSKDRGPMGKLEVRNALGGLLLVLAFLGYLAHGSLSPLVFGSLGLLLVLWGRIAAAVPGSRLKPVKESALLRSWPLPISWAAVAQVKPLTRDVGRALAGVTGTAIVSASETIAIYVVVERRALSERSAEEAIMAGLRDTALSLSSLGAYLLPLDSTQAMALFQPSLEPSKAVESGWSDAVASGSYDLLSIRQDEGFARSLGLYRKADQGREGRARIPSASREFVHPPFLMEVFKAIGSRLTWPNPDAYTAFLSSLLATSGEPVGTRILDAGAASQSQMVLVKSQASPPVELSRAQLRAVVRMYDKGTREWRDGRPGDSR